MMTSLFKLRFSTHGHGLRLLLIVCVTAALAGCAELYPTKAPAPVFQGGGIGARTLPEPLPYPAAKPARPSEDSADNIDTKPLPSSPDIKATAIEPETLPTTATEQSLLTPEQEQELATLEHAQQSPADTSEAPAPNQETSEQAPTTPPPFEPLQTFAPQSPAVGALVLAANKNSEQGNTDSAATVIERAIRIEPRNATLYYKLALLRLEQGKPRLAEDLAKKALLLASGDKPLKKHSWLLIAKARDMQNNPDGAKEARTQAEKY